MSVQSNLSIYERYKRYSVYLAPVVSDPLIRSYFGLVASILLVAFFLIFALSPTFNTILGLQKKIKDQQMIVSAFDEKITALIQAQDVYSQIQKQTYLVDLAMPDKPNPQGIAADVVSTASSSGAVLTSLQFQAVPLTSDAVTAKTVISNGLPTVTFNASVVGTQDQVRHFLGDLEKQLRYIRIDSVTINYGAKIGLPTADVTGLGYYIGYSK